MSSLFTNTNVFPNLSPPNISLPRNKGRVEFSNIGKYVNNHTMKKMIGRFM